MALTRPPLSVARHLILPEVLTIILIACSPPRAWVFIGLILCAYLAFSGIFSTTGQGFHDYFIGTTILTQLATAIALIWLTDPMPSRESQRENEAGPTKELTLSQRIYWALNVKYNPRGIGCSFQVLNIPASPTLSRWAFVRSRLLRTLGYFTLIDIAEAYIYYNPLFSFVGDKALPITAQGYFLCCISILAHGVKPYGTLNFQHSLYAVVSVGAGFSEPWQWPALFGSLSDAYSVRRFWGRTWHQLMRRYLTILGKSTARTFGFKPKTTLFFFVELYAVFLFSGIVHSGGDFMMNPQYLGVSLPFFLYQALAITFEAIVIAVVNHSGVPINGSLARLIGYGWVVLFFSVSMPAFFNLLAQSGLSRATTFPYSPTKALLNHLEKRTGFDVGSSLFGNLTDLSQS